MRNGIIFVFALFFQLLLGEGINANKIVEKIDQNMLSKTQIATVKMIVHGRRRSREMTMKSYQKNNKDTFTEYLSPSREKGTKMLKLDDELWIYSPKTDRIIRISGHMLRQSVMGSDLSYEDLMTESNLVQDYVAKILQEEVFQNRNCWVLELVANSPEIAYAKRKIWVDKERFITLKEELFGVSGKMLKKTEIREVFENKERWYPKHIVFYDMIKQSKGTEIIIEEIEFNPNIEDRIFTKASLRK